MTCAASCSTSCRPSSGAYAISVSSPHECPACGAGQMLVAARFEPGDAAPALEDTS